jgi:HAD superfamily hydrolase (TIGR01509 family)
MIQAIILDFDGTIIDSETPDYQAWQEIYRSFGLDLPLLDWARDIGRRSGDIPFNPYDDLSRKLGGQIDLDETRARHKERFRELMTDQKLRPGIREYLDSAQQLGLALAVASSASHGWLHENLANLGIKPLLASILCSSDVVNAKPDPELYIKTLLNLNLDVSEALVIEDSPNGIRAAKAAGLYCVATPNSLTRHLDLTHADLVVDNLEALPLEMLLDLASPLVPT